MNGILKNKQTESMYTSRFPSLRFTNAHFEIEAHAAKDYVVLTSKYVKSNSALPSRSRACHTRNLLLT